MEICKRLPNLLKESISIETVFSDILKIIGEHLACHTIAVSIRSTVHRDIFIHKNQLIQVLLNIIGNAGDALMATMPQNPVINITVNEREDALSIRICDNGGGIPEAIIHKIKALLYDEKAQRHRIRTLYLSDNNRKELFGFDKVV